MAIEKRLEKVLADFGFKVKIEDMSKPIGIGYEIHNKKVTEIHLKNIEDSDDIEKDNRVNKVIRKLFKEAKQRVAANEKLIKEQIGLLKKEMLDLYRKKLEIENSFSNPRVQNFLGGFLFKVFKVPTYNYLPGEEFSDKLKKQFDKVKELDVDKLFNKLSGKEESTLTTPSAKPVASVASTESGNKDSKEDFDDESLEEENNKHNDEKEKIKEKTKTNTYEANKEAGPFSFGNAVSKVVSFVANAFLGIKSIFIDAAKKVWDIVKSFDADEEKANESNPTSNTRLFSASQSTAQNSVSQPMVWKDKLANLNDLRAKVEKALESKDEYFDILYDMQGDKAVDFHIVPKGYGIGGADDNSPRYIEQNAFTSLRSRAGLENIKSLLDKGELNNRSYNYLIDNLNCDNSDRTVQFPVAEIIGGEEIKGIFHHFVQTIEGASKDVVNSPLYPIIQSILKIPAFLRGEKPKKKSGAKMKK